MINTSYYRNKNIKEKRLLMKDLYKIRKEEQ